MEYEILTPWHYTQKWIDRYWLLRYIAKFFLIVIKSACCVLKNTYIILYHRSNKVKTLHTRLRKVADNNHPLITFLRSVLLNPRAMGAVLPSSKHLAKAMLDYVDIGTDEVIVELGGGTGVITRAILEKNISPKQVIVVEYMPELAERLQKDFPGIQVIHGNAMDLEELLYRNKKPVRAIVSGLPLRSLPKTMKNEILLQISKVLAPNGQYIQFTYDIRKHSATFFPENYFVSKSKIVWRNFPPAKVCLYTIPGRMLYMQKDKSTELISTVGSTAD